jgi:hypothetical protein
MTYIVEILNPAHKSVETFTCPYEPFLMVTDHTGRHPRPQTQREHFEDAQDFAWQFLYDHPGHTAIIFDVNGTPLGVIDEEED